MQSQEVGLVNFATVWQTPYFNSRVLQHRLVFYFAADKGIPVPRVFRIIVVALVDQKTRFTDFWWIEFTSKMADKDKDDQEKTIAEDLVVTKYKMAGEISNRKLISGLASCFP